MAQVKRGGRAMGQAKAQNRPTSDGRSHGVLPTGGPSTVAAPTRMESLLPVFGGAAEAGYAFNHGHPLIGVTDLAETASDGLFSMEPAAWGIRAVRDGMRRGFEKQMALSWTKGAVRSRLQTAGLVKKTVKGSEEAPQELHHAIIPHGGWGKDVPDWIKNSSWNLKPLEQATHRRIHGAFKGAPRFNPVVRTWVGTPNHMKEAVGVITAHGARSVAGHIEGQNHGR